MSLSHLYRSIETAALITDSVLVSFSGGKDSVVTLDLCVKHFKCVEAFFMYEVQGLSFQESILRFYEDKYGLPIHRIPSFYLSKRLRYGLFRPYDYSVPVLSIKDIYEYMRDMTDLYWIAGGERINESLWRRGMLKATGTIDAKRGRLYPIAEWTKKEIMAYIRQNKLKVGIDSARLGFSFGSFLGNDLEIIKKYFPQDYAKIKEWFPLVDASIKNINMQAQ